MMNVHDQAHQLARAIKESDEYRQYVAAKNAASQNPDLAEMLNDFQAQQFELQKKQLMGEQLGPEVMSQVQSLYQILMADPLAARYVQAEMRLTLMVNDVYNILGEVMKSEQQ